MVHANIPLPLGTVKDGKDWFTTEYYQNNTEEMHATIAIDITHEVCVWSEAVIPVRSNTSLNALDFTVEQEVRKTIPTRKSIQYFY